MSSTPIQIDENAISLRAHIKKVLPDGIKDIHLLMVGKTGTGKTSLANALLKNQSSGGLFGANVGTEELVTSLSSTQDGITTHLYDIRGFYDGNIRSEDIVAAVQQKCSMKQLNAVIVCLRWDCRFDESDKKVFRLLNEMNPDIWKRTIVALTFCDHLAPEVSQCKSNDEKCQITSCAWSVWENAIKEELTKLEVPSDVINNIKICPATHTGEQIDPWCFSFILQDDWLQSFWCRFFENANNYPEIFSLAISLATVAATYQKVGVASGVVTAILGGVVGAVVGAGAGVASAGAIVKINAVAAVSTVVSSIAIGGPVGGAVVGTILGVVAVSALAVLTVYFIYKLHQHILKTE